MALTIFTSPRFADHLTPPGHPERVERFEVMQVVVDEFRSRGGTVLAPRPATDLELGRVHTREHIALIRDTAGRAVSLDPDTFTSPESFVVATLAAGAVVAAVDHVLGTEPSPRADATAPRRALAVVRPPGHHAERDRAMGFCLFNNIAVGAAHARARGLSRVAIVDYDVHHGNGTQWSFYAESSVLFISSHQFPFYPGTGAADEVGSDAGKGFTINLPLAAGAGDADYEQVYGRVALPVLRQFRPELILISAGFDAHVDDPLGGMQVSDGCFGRLTAAIAQVADECCQGRVVAVTEGGYDLKGLAGSLRASVAALEGNPSGASQPAAEGTTTPVRGEATIRAVSPHLGGYWKL